jgi:hypothetical protein
MHSQATCATAALCILGVVCMGEKGLGGVLQKFDLFPKLRVEERLQTSSGGTCTRTLEIG